jgi:hypothetical protein
MLPIVSFRNSIKKFLTVVCGFSLKGCQFATSSSHQHTSLSCLTVSLCTGTGKMIGIPSLTSTEREVAGALRFLTFFVKSVNHAGASIFIAWGGGCGSSILGNVLHRLGGLYTLCDLEGGVNKGTTGLGRNMHSLLLPCGVTADAAGLNGNVDRVGVDGDPGIMGAVLSRLCNIISDSSIEACSTLRGVSSFCQPTGCALCVNELFEEATGIVASARVINEWRVYQFDGGGRRRKDMATVSTPSNPTFANDLRAITWRGQKVPL